MSNNILGESQSQQGMVIARNQWKETYEQQNLQMKSYFQNQLISAMHGENQIQSIFKGFQPVTFDQPLNHMIPLVASANIQQQRYIDRLAKTKRQELTRLHQNYDSLFEDLDCTIPYFKCSQFIKEGTKFNSKIWAILNDPADIIFQQILNQFTIQEMINMSKSKIQKITQMIKMHQPLLKAKQHKKNPKIILILMKYNYITSKKLEYSFQTLIGFAEQSKYYPFVIEVVKNVLLNPLKVQIKKNLSAKAQKLLQKLIEIGMPQAFLLQGFLYMQSKKNGKKAYERFKNVEQLGEKRAAYVYLVQLFMLGTSDVQKNYRIAQFYLQKLDENNIYLQPLMKPYRQQIQKAQQIQNTKNMIVQSTLSTQAVHISHFLKTKIANYKQNLQGKQLTYFRQITRLKKYQTSFLVNKMKQFYVVVSPLIDSSKCSLLVRDSDTLAIECVEIYNWDHINPNNLKLFYKIGTKVLLKNYVRKYRKQDDLPIYKVQDPFSLELIQQISQNNKFSLTNVQCQAFADCIFSKKLYDQATPIYQFLTMRQIVQQQLLSKVYSKLGQISEIKNQVDEAIKSYEESIRLRQSEQTIIRLSQIYLKKNMFIKAQPLINKISNNPLKKQKLQKEIQTKKSIQTAHLRAKQQQLENQVRIIFSQAISLVCQSFKVDQKVQKSIFVQKQKRSQEYKLKRNSRVLKNKCNNQSVLKDTATKQEASNKQKHNDAAQEAQQLKRCQLQSLDSLNSEVMKQTDEQLQEKQSGKQREIILDIEVFQNQFIDRVCAKRRKQLKSFYQNKRQNNQIQGLKQDITYNNSDYYIKTNKKYDSKMWIKPNDNADTIYEHILSCFTLQETFKMSQIKIKKIDELITKYSQLLNSQQNRKNFKRILIGLKYNYLTLKKLDFTFQTLIGYAQESNYHPFVFEVVKHVLLNPLKVQTKKSIQDKAKRCLQKITKIGMPEAFLLEGILHMRNKNKGKKAYEMFKIVQQLGEKNAASLNLAELFMIGTSDVQKNYRIAANYLEKLDMKNVYIEDLIKDHLSQIQKARQIQNFKNLHIKSTINTQALHVSKILKNKLKDYYDNIQGNKIQYFSQINHLKQYETFDIVNKEKQLFVVLAPTLDAQRCSLLMKNMDNQSIECVQIHNWDLIHPDKLKMLYKTGTKIVLKNFIRKYRKEDNLPIYKVEDPYAIQFCQNRQTEQLQISNQQYMKFAKHLYQKNYLNQYKIIVQYLTLKDPEYVNGFQNIQLYLQEIEAQQNENMNPQVKSEEEHIKGKIQQQSNSEEKFVGSQDLSCCVQNNSLNANQSQIEVNELKTNIKQIELNQRNTSEFQIQFQKQLNITQDQSSHQNINQLARRTPKLPYINFNLNTYSPLFKILNKNFQSASIKHYYLQKNYRQCIKASYNILSSIENEINLAIFFKQTIQIVFYLISSLIKLDKFSLQQNQKVLKLVLAIFGKVRKSECVEELNKYLLLELNKFLLQSIQDKNKQRQEENETIEKNLQREENETTSKSNSLNDITNILNQLTQNQAQPSTPTSIRKKLSKTDQQQCLTQQQQQSSQSQQDDQDESQQSSFIYYNYNEYKYEHYKKQQKLQQCNQYDQQQEREQYQWNTDSTERQYNAQLYKQIKKFSDEICRFVECSSGIMYIVRFQELMDNALEKFLRKKFVMAAHSICRAIRSKVGIKIRDHNQLRLKIREAPRLTGIISQYNGNPKIKICFFDKLEGHNVFKRKGKK